MVKKLKKLGFVTHHQVGSHLTMKHPIHQTRAVIPIHLKDLKKGTLLAILRESGIEKEEFVQA
ncbi:MAG: type II toxin-antitoxin system HicA family toxin [Patescibacteria group bacterium]